LEFVPLDGGSSISTGQETSQPNRACARYWARGLRPVYIDGALARALNAPSEPACRRARSAPCASAPDRGRCPTTDECASRTAARRRRAITRGWRNRLSTPVQNPTVPPVENPTDR